MLHKAWNSKGEMPYCFPKSSIKFQGHTDKTSPILTQIGRFWTICRSQLSNPSDLPCSRSYIELQGHTALKIVDFDPNWTFPDCISSLKSPMATKWCTKFEIALKRCIEEVPYWLTFSLRSSIILQGHTALKIVEFDPNWAFPDCNSSLNSPMATKWCTKLEVE